MKKGVRKNEYFLLGVTGVLVSFVLYGYVIENPEKGVRLFITKIAEPIGQYRAEKGIKRMEKVLEISDESVKKNR